MNMAKGVLSDKSFAFAVRIVRLSQFLVSEKKEFVLSKQIIRSGTSIGAMTRESEYAESKADFIHKLSIALKEANETIYWLDLLKETHFIEDEMYNSLKTDSEELLKLLISIIKTTKSNLKK